MKPLIKLRTMGGSFLPACDQMVVETAQKKAAVSAASSPL